MKNKRRTTSFFIIIIIILCSLNLVFNFTFGANKWNIERSNIYIQPISIVGIYTIVILMFVLKNKKTEKELKISVERYKNLFESTLDIIFSLSTEGKIASLNKAFERITGFPRESWIGKPLIALISPQDHSLFLEKFNSLTQTNLPAITELRIITQKNESINCEMTFAQSDLIEANIKITGIIRNISERKKAEQDLAAEKERLAVTLSSIGDGVIATDIEGKIVLLNQVAEELTGWNKEEAIGRALSDVFTIFNESQSRTQDNPVSKVLATGTSVGLTKNTLLISKNGYERFISCTGSPIKNNSGIIIGVVLVFRDISERRKSEEEMLKSQRLESIGVLAGGIAHDFNNILAGILANTQLAKLMFLNGKDITKYLVSVEDAVTRATALTRQLLTFSKGGAPIKKITSIIDLIKETVVFTLRGSNVKCVLNLASDLWPAEIDSNQISQVINNLIINANQAMPDGGVINVSAENLYNETDNGSLDKGIYVKITIKDHGIGIPEENLPFIFDPYFTTKVNGSGLGLATSYSIIKRHGGHIEVESKSGNGTMFTIYLPASMNNWMIDTDMASQVLKGEGRVLVMDDDDMIRSAAGQMLNHLGYEVEFAKDGQEVLDYYKNKKNFRPFDVIIMDLTVPGGMGGKSTIEQLLKLDPSVKVIVSSGYSNNPIMAEYKKYGFSGVVTKPYKIEELSEALYQVLLDKKDILINQSQN